MYTRNQKQKIREILEKYLERAAKELNQNGYFGTVDVAFFDDDNNKILAGSHFINKENYQSQ